MQNKDEKNIKEFVKWNDKKIIINNLNYIPFFHEREIWFCSLGVNVGFEQDGRGEDFQRPVVIIRKFNNDVCWVIPLSKTKKRGKYYFAFNFEEDIVSVAILSQIKLMDARRLSRNVGYISEKDYAILIEKLKALLP